MPVAISPGSINTHRIPKCRTSRCSDSVKASSANLEALYAARSGEETRPFTLDTFTMTPEPRFRQAGNTAWIYAQRAERACLERLSETIKWIAFHRASANKYSCVVDDCIERTNLFKALRHPIPHELELRLRSLQKNAPE